MSEVQHQQDADQIDGLLAAQIASLVAEEGVPGNFDKMWEFLQLLMPIVGAARASYHGAAVASMTRAMDGHGLEVAPAGLRQWSSNAAWKMLARAMGWNVYRDPIPKQFDSYPPAAQRALIERVVSFPEDPFDPVAVEQATQRIATGAIRHARAAGRDAVVDTADGNLVRRADTQEVLSPGRRDIEVVDGERVAVDTDEKSEVLEQWELEHPAREDYDRSAEGLRGKVLGWARVLTGAENCPWCAMLASRGPVYTETTVLTGTTRSASRDGLRYHDHCDCTAVLVVRGQPWEGEAQFTALQDLWEDARDNPTQLEMEEGLRTPQSRFDKRYRDLIEEDPHRFSLSDRPLSFEDKEEVERGKAPRKLGDAVRKGAKRTRNSAADGTNPTADRDNCVRCVNTWALRLLGYNEVASAGQPGITAEASTLTWRNERGQGPQWERSDLVENALKWREVKEELGKKPEGAFGFIRYRAQFGYAHVGAWQIIEGKLELIDPQDVSNDLEDGLEHSFTGSIRWTDLSGFSPTMETLSLVRGDRHVDD